MKNKSIIDALYSLLSHLTENEHTATYETFGESGIRNMQRVMEDIEFIDTLSQNPEAES